MKIPRSLLQAVSIAALAVCLHAQTPQPPGPSFKAATDLVEVDVIVSDKSGHFVSDLSMEDFELRDEGHPQQLQQLYLRLTTSNAWAGGREATADRAPAPIAGATTGLPAPPRQPDLFMVVFDDAHMTSSAFQKTQAAALNLFTRQLHAGDFGGVVANGHIVNNRVTSDRDELIKAVKSARPNHSKNMRAFEEAQWPRLTETEAVQIVVNGQQDVLGNAITRACADDRTQCVAGDAAGAVAAKANQLAESVRAESAQTLQLLDTLLIGLGKFDGRKTVVLLTEGFLADDSWSLVKDAVSLAARVNARIYTLDARGATRGLVSVDQKMASDNMMRVLEQMDMGADSVNSLAVDTGGFVVRNTNMFDRAIAKIMDDATNYYVLGYTPTATPDGKFHKISVTVKRPGVTVRARRGYTAAPRAAGTLRAGAAPAARPSAGGSEPWPEPAAGSPAEPVAPLDSPELPAPPVALGSAHLENETANINPASAVRWRPDADKHIDLLLPNPSADKAASDGWDAYQRGDVVGARMALSVAVTSPSAEPWTHYMLGQADYALREYREAVTEWEKVRAMATGFEPVYFDLVDGYVQLKEPDKAIRLLRDGALRWPKDPDMFNALGVVQTSHGALDDAIGSFRKGIEANPSESTSYFNLGKAMELRYFARRRFYEPTKRWIANEQDRRDAIENYRRYLASGGPYSQQAREGLARLEWRQ
ncbi:MAG TPA: VWA domain-containing protein [Vicinamibacterales bacterium]